MRVSLKVKLLVPVIAVFIYIAFSTFLVHKTLQDQKYTGLVINIAGRQRMLTQKMTKELLLYLKTHDESYKKQLSNTMKIFEICLNALTDSGKVPLSLNLNKTKWAYVPPSTGKVHQQLLKVKKIWDEFKRRVDELLRGVNEQENLKWIATNNIRLLKEMNRAVFMMQYQAEAKLNRLRMYQFVGLGIGLVAIIAVIAALVVVDRRVKEAREKMLNCISDGSVNLEEEISDRSGDEISEIVNAASQIISTFKGRLMEIIDRTCMISADCPEAANAGVNVKTISDEYADMVADIVQAIKELKSAIEDLAQETQTAALSAEEAHRLVEDGVHAIRASVEKSGMVKETIEELSAETEELREASEKISSIVEVINSISEQTNLLALNAAIEAARAGEHGRGFAVVADEVRKLAEETMKATKDIEEMVNRILESIKKVDKKSEETSSVVKEQMEAVEEGVSGLEKVLEHISQLNNMIMKVSAATEEQSAAVAQIAESSEVLDRRTMDLNSNSVNALEKIDHMITSIAQLIETTTKFKLKEGFRELREGLKKHLVNTMKVLKYCMDMGADISDIKLDHTECPFGKYLEKAREVLGHETYGRLVELHRRWHEIVRGIVEAKGRGDREQIVKLTDELAETSSQLIKEIASSIQE